MRRGTSPFGLVQANAGNDGLKQHPGLPVLVLHGDTGDLSGGLAQVGDGDADGVVGWPGVGYRVGYRGEGQDV